MTYKKKLIEVAIPLAKINEESAREKSIRDHPQSIHRWWARRPLAATRSVLFAQLVDDPSSNPERFPTPQAQSSERERLFGIMERLAPTRITDPSVLSEARAAIRESCDGELPRILDPFGGGGAIPLESLRLGLPTFSGDLNPVAVLIQRALLQVPSLFAGRPPVHPQTKYSRGIWTGADGLAEDVTLYGAWMQEEAKRRIGHHFPDSTLDKGIPATPIAWIWARTIMSPDPSWSQHVPLVRSWDLSRKPGKPAMWVEPVVDTGGRTVTYRVRQGGRPGPATIERGNGTCIATGTPIPGEYIKAEAAAGRMGQTLIAVVVHGPAGREFLSPTKADLDAADCPMPRWLPEGAMSQHPQYMGTPRYGLDEWSRLFTARQLLALTTLGDLLSEVRERVLADIDQALGAPLHSGGRDALAYADAIHTYLALAVSKATDFNCSTAYWDPVNVKVNPTFVRQAIAMTWDFAEVNTLGDRVGSFASMVDSVSSALRAVPTGNPAAIEQRDARARISEVGTCVVATDPPYYDNVPYSDLSDFFYVWLRQMLKGVWPDECATLLAPKVDELVANHLRAGSKSAAQQHFEFGMQGVFGRASEVVDPRYPATVFYAFKATQVAGSDVSSTGWETFLSGLLDAGFTVTATWPIRTELPNRMRANAANALATSVVLACRLRSIAAPLATRSEFVAAMRREMPPSIRLLQEQNIAPVDMAQSAIGPGISVFSRYAKVVEADGSPMTVRTALALVNEVLAEVLSGEEGEFDADTRFAVTWFEQYNHNPGPYGDADTLSKAKNTTVDNVVRSGIAATRDGRLRLVERGELPDDWDPTTDSRLTVWETTQHLIVSLEQSETAAAELLRRMGGGVGERARQLAYLLYGICDRKKWAEEAGSYNMLVTAWPTIERLAAAPAATGEGQLF